MAAADPRRRAKTFAARMHRPEPARPAPARGRPEAHRAPAPAAAPSASRRRAEDLQAVRRPEPGRPLDPAVQRRLEEGLDRPLGHVRIHAAPHERDVARSQGARAIAHRHHIWLGPHESPGDAALLGHEAAHVAQQGYAPRAAAAAGGPAPAAPIRGPGPHGPAVAGPAPGRGAAAGARGAAAAAPVAAVQRWDLWDAAGDAADFVASGVSSAAGAVAEVAGDLADMAMDGLLEIVDTVAPSFRSLFEGDGIAGFIERLVESGLRALFDGLLGPLRGLLDFSSIGERVSEAVGWISAVAGQLSASACTGILAAARQVGAFFDSALSPVVDTVRSVAESVSGFFRSIWEAIGAPIMDILRNIGGEIWESLKGFVADVADVIRTVRNALGGAWDRVKRWFGVEAEDGEGEGGGLWEWIKGKAAAFGESVAELVRPVIGPLRTVGAVLLLIFPGGQILAVMLMWPRLKAAWNQLTQMWDDLNLIPRSREFLANTVLPALMSAAETVGQTLVAGADWLLGLASQVTGALQEAIGAATGLLGPLGTLLGFALEQFQHLVEFARGGLRWVSRNMRMLLDGLVRFLGLLVEIMRTLMSIFTNPFGIVGFLAGTLWRLVPDCLKGPIIDFIIDIIRRVLRALPPMPLLGPLWPLVKSAALGFLDRVMGFSTPRKVNVSIKLAKIVSGMSPSFAFGYLKGLALGVWDGIIAPFQAIATIFELPTMVQTFLANLGIRLCELIESIRCFAANLVGRVFGSLDEVLAGLGQILENPSKIIDLIRCAIEGALAGAAALGGKLADQMMEVFESADEAIGEQLGRLAGNALVQAVITYFTAGAGAVRMLTQLLGKLVGFLRALASRFASAVASGARGVLGRLGGFFRRVAAWFKKLLARMFRFLRRKFALSPQQRLQWLAFRGAVGSLVAGHVSGITRRQLRGAYQRVLSSHRPVAKRPAFITKHGPHWRLWVRKVKRPLPRVVGEVLLDPRTRVHAAMKAVKRTVRGLKRAPGILGLGQISRALPPVQRRFHLRTLTAAYDRAQGKFKVHGVANPEGDWKTRPERPPRNVITNQQPGRAITVDPLTELHLYANPMDPPGWTELAKIKAVPAGTHSTYVRGHIAHGRFTSGAPWNIMPITRSANGQMRAQAEGHVISKLSLAKKPVFKYQVTTTPPAPGVLRPRMVDGVCRPVPEESQLVRSITVRHIEYDFSGEQWNVVVNQVTDEIENVPSYPPGKGDACTPGPPDAGE
jgi:phage-related protein